MIEFQVASLANNPEGGDFWQGLHAASVALQQAVQSETAVYQVFSEQLTKLGLHGSINLLDESRTRLHVVFTVFSEKLMQFMKRAEKAARVNALQFSYSIDDVAAESLVLTNGSIVFLADNTEKMQQVIPPKIFRFIAPLIKPFIHIPAIIAPLFAESKIIGVLYLAGAELTQKDVPAIGAFATHLSIALENARLFQVVRQREEQFRVLAENVPGVIYLVKNEQNYPLIYINEKIETLTGYSREQLIRREVTLADLIHPDDHADSGMLLDGLDLTPADKYCFVYRVRHRSGIWRWVEDVGSGAYNSQGELLFLEGVISDITERIQSEQLQKTVYRIADVASTSVSLDELYRSIHQILALQLDVENFYIALYDEATDTIEVPYFVDQFDTLTGRYQAGTGLAELVVRENCSQLLTRQQIEARIAEGVLSVRGKMPEVWLGVPLRTHETAVGAMAVQSYKATTAYSERDQQFLLFVSEQIARAIERKQAEERQRVLSAELTQQTRLLEAILAATPDNFLVFDLNGRFQFISNAILNYLQVSVRDVVGKTWQELNLPSAFGQLSDQDRAAVLETGQLTVREFIYPMPDGDVEIEFLTSPVLGPSGEIVSFVTTARDITERKQTMRAMHRAQKIESLGILAGGIAHDFNNLLVAMLGQTSLAQSFLQPEDPAFGHVAKAVEAAEQAANLTRQLLAYSGGGQFTIQPINLNALIQKSLDLLKVALPKQVQLKLELATELPNLEGDTTQLQQVLMNLIINAAEAIGEQAGVICVGTAVATLTLQDSHFWRFTDQPLPEGLYVHLYVQDSGTGMAEETLTKIFDPFFTTKFTGRGLGLAAVLGIVRSHHGGLHVASEADQGTQFELLFPIVDKPIEIPLEELIEMEKHKEGLVLVIDDERAVREAVADILEMEGINVLAAANGDEGIALYQKHHEQIDLVLLDLSMPGKSGHETFLELEAFDSNVRIMLSSGYSESDAIRGFASPPLVGFLQKPYRLDTFMQRLNKFL